jgi:hypothetical protein
MHTAALSHAVTFLFSKEFRHGTKEMHIQGFFPERITFEFIGSGIIKQLFKFGIGLCQQRYRGLYYGMSMTPM